MVANLGRIGIGGALTPKPFTPQQGQIYPIWEEPGATDNARIQSAINRASAAGGGRVLIPARSTAYSVNLTFPDGTTNVTLMGQGFGTVLQSLSAGGPTISITGGHTGRLGLEDMWIQGPPTPGAQGAAIYIDASTVNPSPPPPYIQTVPLLFGQNLIVSNNGAGPGIWLHEGQGVSFVNCQILELVPGVGTDGYRQDNDNAGQCWFWDLQTVGWLNAMNITGGGGVRVTLADIFTPRGTGITFAPGDTGAQGDSSFYHVSVDSPGGHGFKLGGGTRNLIRCHFDSCQVTLPAGSASDCYWMGSGCTSLKFNECMALGAPSPGSNGFSFNHASITDVMINAATCQNCSAGFYLPTAATHFRIQNCFSSGQSSNNAIFCPPGTAIDWFVVVGNDFSGQVLGISAGYGTHHIFLPADVSSTLNL